MPDDEFERHKEALAAQKLERPKRLSTQFNKFLNEISMQQYHFERAEKEVAILKKITKDELLVYYQNYILPDGVSRQPLAIHIVSTAEDGAGHPDTAKPEGESADDKPFQPKDGERIIITDLASFKSSKELYPMVQPYISIQPKGGRSKL